MPKPFLLTPIAASLVLIAAVSPAERPWEPRMQEFERQDAASPAAAGGVVFVGSSSIRLWDLGASFGPDSPTPLDGPLLNRGFGGSQIEHSIEQVELLVLRHLPRQVVLYAGDNDIAAGKGAERVAADFDRFVAAVRAELPEAKIAFVAIKPSLARWELADTMRDANRRISDRCEQDDRLRYLDIWTPMLGADGRPREELLVADGLHLSAEGYSLWADVMHAAIGGETQ